MKKIKIMLLIVLAAFIAVPSVSAAESFKEVKDITNTETANEGKYTKVAKKSATSDNKTTTFDIQDTNLIVLEKGSRPVEDAAWFGVGVQAPEGGVSSPCWKRDYANQNGTTCTSATQDGQDSDYTLWIPFTAAEMKAAIEKDGPNAIITKKATIYWKGATETENYQEIIVNLHAGSVQLVIDPDKSGEVKADAAFTEAERKVAIATYEASKAKNELDDVPNTGSTLPIALMGLLTLVTGTGIYTLKTAYSRK